LPASARGSSPTLVLWKIEGRSIHDLVLLPISSVKDFFERQKNEDEATDLLLTEIRARLRFLSEVGLGYLTLDRQSAHPLGRRSAAHQPHHRARHVARQYLIRTGRAVHRPAPARHGARHHVMHRLRDAGNSLVVVEHDRRSCSPPTASLDMDPDPASAAGEIVFLRSRRQDRGRAHADRRLSFRTQSRSRDAPRAAPPRIFLTLEGARSTTSRTSTMRFPLERLGVRHRVSGSGKSTLVQDVLYPAMRKAKGQPTESPGAHKALKAARR
jgi:excinuclease ABC subunit A